MSKRNSVGASNTLFNYFTKTPPSNKKTKLNSDGEDVSKSDSPVIKNEIKKEKKKRERQESLSPNVQNTDNDSDSDMPIAPKRRKRIRINPMDDSDVENKDNKNEDTKETKTLGKRLQDSFKYEPNESPKGNKSKNSPPKTLMYGAHTRGGPRRGMRTLGGRGGDLEGVAVLPTNEHGRRARQRAGRRGSRSRGRSISQRLSASDLIQIFNVEELPVGEQLERPLTIKKVRTWNPNLESNEVNVHSENQRSPIPHEVQPSPAMYVECGGSANGTSSTSGCFNVEVSIDEDNNFSASSIVNRKHHLREQEKIGRSAKRRVKRVCRSLCEEGPQLAVTSSVAASSSSDRNPAASLRPQQPLRDLEIERLLHYGSEEESESEDDELEAPVLVPRALRVLWETPVDEEEEVVERAAPSSAPEDGDVEVAEKAAPSSASESYLPQNFLDFEWRSFPNPPIPPETRREPFRHTDCGPTIKATDPYDIFTSIWDQEFMEFVATETNRYAQEVADKMMRTGELCLNSRIVDWKDTTADELYTYMAIILAMGVVIKSRTAEYWNTDMDIFCTPGFGVNMSLRRFQLLNKCLHFNSTANMVGLNLSASEAKLFRVQPVISHLNAKFSALYVMQQNIALDESLLQWKGWLDINQFIPNKAAAVGIKSYEICESATGYLWRFQIHTHKPRTPQAAQDADPFTASTPALVLDLIKGLEHAGYTLWMDNFYNSPALARKLKSIGFDCVGTLRTNRKLVPVELNNLTKTSMRPGQIAGFTSGDVDVMVWRDQNRVATISTYHGNAVSTVDNSTKPMVIRDYNVYMGGVDKKDQMLATYPIERKRTRIWYKKLFRRLINVSTLNAYIIHKKNATVKFSHRNFRRTLINTILEKHAKPAVIPTPARQGIYEAKCHYPALYPFLVTPGSSNRQRHVCRVCHKRTTTFCAGCNIAVCAFTCFSALHA